MIIKELNRQGPENAINRPNCLKLALKNWMPENLENRLIDADLNEINTYHQSYAKLDFRALSQKTDIQLD
jgi:hypothetical protein